jgi:hypothetical protein
MVLGSISCREFPFFLTEKTTFIDTVHYLVLKRGSAAESLPRSGYCSLSNCRRNDVAAGVAIQNIYEDQNRLHMMNGSSSKLLIKRLSRQIRSQFNMGIFYVLYSSLLQLPPFRFRCVGGCWDRNEDTLALAAGRSNHSARSHLQLG